MNNSYLVSKVLDYYRSKLFAVVLIRSSYELLEPVRLLDGLGKLHVFLRSYFSKIFYNDGIIMIGNNVYHDIDSMPSLRIDIQDRFYWREIYRSTDEMIEMIMYVKECEFV